MASSALIRNNEAGPTVFEYDGGKSKVEWAGAGDPMGGDLMPVPTSYLEDVQFLSCLQRGIFSVEEAPEAIREAIELHRQEWVGRQERAKSASQASLDEAPQNDMLMLSCIGPSGKNTSQPCGAQVSVKQRARNETPPLCSMHKSLAGQYIAEEGEKIVDGKPEIRWIRAGLGNRAKQD